MLEFDGDFHSVWESRNFLHTLRGLLNDLAVTRIKRRQLEKNEALLVSVDDVIKKFAKAEAEPRKREGLGVEGRRVVLGSRRALLSSWIIDCRKLRLSVRRGKSVG